LSVEQLVDDYLKAKGYFTRHNIKFRPEKGDPDFNVKTDSVNSDIDVLAINPNISGPERVIVVTCKSWQDGLRPEKLIDAFNRDLKISGRPAWKGFREITRKKWANAFCRHSAIFEASLTLAVSVLRRNQFLIPSSL